MRRCSPEARAICTSGSGAVTPTGSPLPRGYTDYREYAAGNGWKVWVKLQGNPPVQQAPLKPAFPVPNYTTPANIKVPDSWLN